MIEPEGRGLNSHPGQSFPLSLCGPNSISRANAHMVYGLKHQHFTLHSITRFTETICQCYIINRNKCTQFKGRGIEIEFNGVHLSPHETTRQWIQCDGLKYATTLSQSKLQS